jgi:hypothetical protein
MLRLLAGGSKGMLEQKQVRAPVLYAWFSASLKKGMRHWFGISFVCFLMDGRQKFMSAENEFQTGACRIFWILRSKGMLEQKQVRASNFPDRPYNDVRADQVTIAGLLKERDRKHGGFSRVSKSWGRLRLLAVVLERDAGAENRSVLRLF